LLILIVDNVWNTTLKRILKLHLGSAIRSIIILINKYHRYLSVRIPLSASNTKCYINWLKGAKELLELVFIQQIFTELVSCSEPHSKQGYSRDKVPVLIELTFSGS
jgi:hypothetical protein